MKTCFGITALFALLLVPCVAAQESSSGHEYDDSQATGDAYVGGAEVPTVLTPGDSATPSAAVVCQVALKDPLVLVLADGTAGSPHAVFLEHGTGERAYEIRSRRYLGRLVAATEEGEVETEGEEEEKTGSTTASQWANALMASFVVSACSLTGLLIVANKRIAHRIGLSHAFLFASGALLTASLLHIIPEAMEGLESEYDNLRDLGLYAGLYILGGMSFGILIQTLIESGHSSTQGNRHHHAMGVMGGDACVSAQDRSMPRSLTPEGDKAAKAPREWSSSLQQQQQQADMIESPPDVTQRPIPTEMSPDNLRALITSRKGRSLLDVKDLQPVCWNIVASDLVHNFVDGVTIGAAFLSCSLTMGWTVTASAVLHEVPQELADFMALLNGGMSMKQAFAYNFLSALSAVLGTIIIMSLGNKLTDAQISIFLLLGAGSFIFIALSELLPEALVVTYTTVKHGDSSVAGSQLRKLASFLFGALVIGATLIVDRECDVGGGDNH